MKTYLFFLLAFVMLSGCTQKSPDNQVDVPTHPLKIKACKMYSSDFVLLDPEEKGLLIQEFRFNRKGFVNELIRYDLDGKIISKFDILGEHTPFPMPEKTQYVDTIITIENTDTLSVKNSTEVKVYNEKGLLVEARMYEADNNIVSKNTYNYDSNNMIKEDVYWDIELDKPKQKIRYEFEYFTD